MKTIRYLLCAGVAAALASFALFSPDFSPPAKADVLVLCRPDPAGAAPGPGRVTNPGVNGGSYNLNSQGCAPISSSNGDAAYFISQGFTTGPNIFSVVARNITAADSSITLPGSTFLQGIVIQNVTTNAVTGGVKIGTTSGGANVLSAANGVCASTCLAIAPAASLGSGNGFSAATQLFIGAATSFNSSQLNVTFMYSYY